MVVSKYAMISSWFQYTPDDGEKEPVPRYSLQILFTALSDSTGVNPAAALSSAATMRLATSSGAPPCNFKTSSNFWPG
jgi:hypothetical protein